MLKILQARLQQYLKHELPDVTPLIQLNVQYIMRSAALDEAQAGIKIAERNISNFRYADDTSLLAESEDKQKSLLMKVKEENEKNEDSLRDLWDNIKHTSIYIIEVPEGEERKDLRRYLKR